MLDFIDLNNSIDFTVILSLFCTYLTILWLAISIWVGVDAWKHFNNRRIAIGFFLLVFILNFPMLIFYFIVRPENQFEEYGEWESQGVNVPIVNFEGKDGVEMALEIKIHPAKMATEQADMKVDVSWESSNPQMKIMADRQIRKQTLPQDFQQEVRDLGNVTQVSTEELRTEVDYQRSPRGVRRVSNVFSNWGGLVRKRINKVKEVSAGYANKRRARKLAAENRAEAGFEPVESNNDTTSKSEPTQEVVKKNKLKNKKDKKKKRDKKKKGRH